MQQDFAQRTLPMPSAPPLDQAQPDGTYVKDALFLALRESQRGEPEKARAQIKTALFQLDQVGDPTAKAYWQGQVDQTTAYVEAQAANAEANKVSAQLSDKSYVNGQKLSVDEQQNLVQDNVDTANLIDAKARGESTLGYEVQPVARAAGKGLAAATNTIGGAAGTAFFASGPFKWVLVAAVLLLVVVAGGYAYTLRAVSNKAGV